MAATALLIIDVVNAFDYPGGDLLLRQTKRVLPALVRLKARARKAASPIVYCNDNFGQWRSDFKAVVAHCTEDDMPGSELVRRIKPDEGDYFILKSKHSAFYQTPLKSLLEDLKVRRLILAGIAGESCIHSTATDAHIREFDVVVCADATASQTRARNRNALQHLETTEYVRLSSSARVRFEPAPDSLRGSLNLAAAHHEIVTTAYAFVITVGAWRRGLLPR